jgi:iron complex outermembrane receptor protein
MHTLTMRQGRRLHLPSRGMAFLLAASLPLLPASAMAQSAGEDGEENFAIEEVIVTAQRREQGLMDVPVAVTAFTGEQLERMGALDIIALTQTTPNTTLEVSRGTNSTLTAFIRGVGQQDPVAGFESGVGIYVDDVYFNRPQAAVLEIFDVERIEILRGPQGTLYGRNTIGGAIKYVTRRLSDGPELKARGRYGNYNMLAVPSRVSTVMVSATTSTCRVSRTTTRTCWVRVSVPSGSRAKTGFSACPPTG